MKCKTQNIVYRYKNKQYWYTGGNSEGLFSIDQASGQISCQQLDRETTAHYNLTIEARDRGSPPQRSSMMLYIEVS